MKMSPDMLVVGGLLVFWASVSLMVIYPALTMQEPASEIYRTESAREREGLDLYVENGCSYCHSLFIRTSDWGEGAQRIAERGDYIAMRPAILGTERTGSDLSQEGGEHPDDWHLAHFINPRTVSPLSLMPSWEFMGREKIALLTAYMQSLGGKAADVRVVRQRFWKEQAMAAYRAGPDSNIAWLHREIPAMWLPMPNPYGATEVDVERGHKIYQQYCIGCHGAVGDGFGSARPYVDPPPLNFTTLRRHLIDNKYIGGVFYYQVMNGITGTGMPYFKRILESEKIWAVSNYIAVSFVGYTDAAQMPRGIEAAGEAPWKNPYSPPDLQKGVP